MLTEQAECGEGWRVFVEGFVQLCLSAVTSLTNPIYRSLGPINLFNITEEAIPSAGLIRIPARSNIILLEIMTLFEK